MEILSSQESLPSMVSTGDWEVGAERGGGASSRSDSKKGIRGSRSEPLSPGIDAIMMAAAQVCVKALYILLRAAILSYDILHVRSDGLFPYAAAAYVPSIILWRRSIKIWYILCILYQFSLKFTIRILCRYLQTMTIVMVSRAEAKENVDQGRKRKRRKRKRKVHLLLDWEIHRYIEQLNLVSFISQNPSHHLLFSILHTL